MRLVIGHSHEGGQQTNERTLYRMRLFAFCAHFDEGRFAELVINTFYNRKGGSVTELCPFGDAPQSSGRWSAPQSERAIRMGMREWPRREREYSALGGIGGYSRRMTRLPRSSSLSWEESIL